MVDGQSEGKWIGPTRRGAPTGHKHLNNFLTSFSTAPVGAHLTLCPMACLCRAGWGGYFFRMDEDPIPDEGHEPEEGGQPDVEWEEAWLQSVANLADAETNLTVMLAEIMKDVEDFTEERWAALPVGMRMEMMDQLQEWQRDKERILSELPIEERRRLE